MAQGLAFRPAPARGRAVSRKFRPGLDPVESRLLLTTFTVTNTDDFGDGSLRQAIFDSNFEGGKNTIVFNIPGSDVQVIRPESPLPQITTPVTIEGYSQPGAAPNTATQGDNATIRIVLDGSGISDPTRRIGLQVKADNTTIRGLSIVNFDTAGIILSGSNDRVEGNFLGVNPSGVTAAPNGLGVGVFGGGAIIGGTGPAARNVISGNAAGVALANMTLPDGAAYPVLADPGLVTNNLIGTDITGTNDLGNTVVGVALAGSGNTVGGPNASDANVIAFNGKTGGLFNAGAGVAVVGLKPTSDAPPALVSSRNLISGNAIYANQKVGIAQLTVPLSTITPFYNVSKINTIAAGTQLINNIEVGANPDVRIPTLTSATNASGGTTISGTLTGAPLTTYRVQFFSGANGTLAGQTFLGEARVTTDAAGVAAITFNPPVRLADGQVVVATAIAPDNTTSQFSNPVTVSQATPTPPTTPLVRVASADVNVRRRRVSSIIVHYSGAVTGAGDPANYELAQIRTRRIRGSRVEVARPIRIRSVAFDTANNTAAIVPRGRIARATVAQLTISAAGIRDAAGRPLDGDRNGTPGGNAVVRIVRFQPTIL